MTELTNIQVTITIEDPNLDNQELQAETQKMRSQLEELGGAEKADLVPIEQVPKDSKTFGGFLLGILTAEVNPANIKKLIRFLSNRLGNKQMKMALKKPSGEELTIEVSSQEEFEYVFEKAQKFLKGE